MLPKSLRDDFPILQQSVHPGRPLVFLDNAASTQRPVRVIDSLRRVYEHDYANVHRGIHTLSERSTDAYEQAREKVRKLLGAQSPQEIIFTSGTTGSINLVAQSWGGANLRPGDEVLVTEMEHHSNLVPWFQIAQRTGATVRHVPVTDEGLLDLTGLENLLTERTKLLAVTSVSNTLGTVNPVAALATRAHAVGAVVLVDAAQSVPHAPTNVVELGADFLAFSGHKMTGPSGVGVLYGRRELLEAMPPFLGGGGMIDLVEIDRFTPAPSPARFEAGTPPIAPAIALGAAVDYLLEIGLDRIHKHEQALVAHAWRRLGEIEGLRLLGPGPELRSSLVSFVLDSPHSHDVAQLLDELGIAVRAGHHCTQPLHKRLGIAASTRASFYLYNTLEEVNALAEGLLAIRTRFRPTGRKRSPR